MAEAQEWKVLYYEDGVPVYACAYHPDRETTLRCGRCGRPICTQCAVLTDVGYRCPDCVAELRGRFYHATPRHVVTALLAAAGLGWLAGLVGGVLASFLGIWSIFLVLPLAGGVAEGIWRAGARHRAPHLHVYAAVVVLLTGILGVFSGLFFLPINLPFALIAVAVVTAVVYRRVQ